MEKLNCARNVLDLRLDHHTGTALPPKGVYMQKEIWPSQKSCANYFANVDELRTAVQDGLQEGVEFLPACSALKASLPSREWTFVWENMLVTFLRSALSPAVTEPYEVEPTAERRWLDRVTFFLGQNTNVQWNGQPFVIDKPHKLIDLVARLILPWGPAMPFHQDFRPAVLSSAADGLPSDLETTPAPRGEGFEASSVLNRAGLFFYSHAAAAVVKKLRLQSNGTQIRLAHMQARWRNGAAEIVKDQELLSVEDLPAQKQRYTRVVLVGDSHMQHLQLGPLPPGDVLIHTGDLSNEEQPSIDVDKFHCFVAKFCGLSDPTCPVDALQLRQRLASRLANAPKEAVEEFNGKLLDLVRAEDFMIHRGLAWLSRQSFCKVALVGGNHDYILEFLTPGTGLNSTCGDGAQCLAQNLCAAYGVEYLWMGRPPVELAGLTVYGSGVSFNGKRANALGKSGNTAFRIDPTAEAAEEVENAIANVVNGTDVDVLVTHGDFAAGSHGAGRNRPGLLFGGEGELPSGERRERACPIHRRALPVLYAYGDSHNAAGGSDLHKYAKLRPLTVTGDGPPVTVPSIFTAVVSAANFVDSVPRVVDVQGKRQQDTVTVTG